MNAIFSDVDEMSLNLFKGVNLLNRHGIFYKNRMKALQVLREQD